MGVEREEVANPVAAGSVTVTRIYRCMAGKWSVEFDIDFRVLVGDGREVYVRRYVNLTATEQRGRKPRSRRRLLHLAKAGTQIAP